MYCETFYELYFLTNIIYNTRIYCAIFDKKIFLRKHGDVLADVDAKIHGAPNRRGFEWVLCLNHTFCVVLYSILVGYEPAVDLHVNNLIYIPIFICFSSTDFDVHFAQWEFVNISLRFYAMLWSGKVQNWHGTNYIVDERTKEKAQNLRSKGKAEKCKQSSRKITLVINRAEISVQYIYNNNNCIIRLLPFLYRSIAYGDGLNNNNELSIQESWCFYRLHQKLCSMLYYIIMT